MAIPLLSKEGWRAAPGWFETMIPQIRQDRYISKSAESSAPIILIHYPFFNPRPPITAGESRGLQDEAGVEKSFNPRPPITAGESLAHGKGADFFGFQSAPANYGRRITLAALAAERETKVSIRARQLRQANPRRDPDPPRRP